VKIGNPNLDSWHEPVLLRILMIGDFRDYAMRVSGILEESGFRLVSRQAPNEASMRQAISDETWDMILAGENSGAFDAIRALGVLQKTGLDVPLIVIAETLPEEAAVALMRAGAHDCLSLPALPRLPAVIARELRSARDRSILKKTGKPPGLPNRQESWIGGEQKTDFRQLQNVLQDSNAWFRSVLDASMIGIFFWNSNGNVTDANHVFLDTIGYTQEELQQGKINWRDLTPPEYTELDETALVVLRKGERLMPYEKQYFHKDGHRVDILVCGIFLEGSQDYGIRFVLDISERKQAERALLQNEKLLRQAQRIAHMGHWEWDLETGVMSWSEELDRIYGLAEGRFNGSMQDLLARFVHPLDQERLNNLIQEVDKTPRAFKLDFRIVRPDGQIRYVNVQGDFEFDAQGNAMKQIGTALDITERKQAEDALLQSQAHLANAQRIAHLGYWDWDACADKVYWSDEVFRMFGVLPQSFEATYDAFIKVVHPEDRARVHQSMQAALLGEAPYEGIQFRVVRADGEVRYIYAQGEVTRDESGQAIRMAGTNLDVTEVKLAELALAESERFHRAVLDALSSQIAILNEQGEILAVNKAWWEFSAKHGVTEAIALGQNYFEACKKNIQRGDFASHALYGMQEVLAGKLHDFSLEYPCETGEGLTWFRMNATRFEGAAKDGSPFFRLVVAHEDITRQRHAQDALNILMSQNEALLNNIPDLAWLKDPAGRYIAVNEPGLDIMPIARQEFIGKTDHDLWPESMARKLQMDDQFVIRTGQRLVIEDDVTLPDGSVMWLETIKSPIRNNEGEIIGTAGIARDITNRKEAESVILQSHEALEQMVAERTAELQAANQSLKENERLRSTFISALTHDLRTPLIAQRRLIELLQDLCEMIDGKAAFLVKGLLQNNENLLDMVNKLLETYQYAEGKIMVTFEPFSLHKMVEDCYDSLREMASSKQIQLLNEVPEDFPEIFADPSLIQRVFINLLGNAVENISAGCEVRITARQGEQMFAIDVADNGKGIDPELLPNIFDRYFTRSRMRQRIGSGLGLFICKMIADLHGGTISVTSELGKGAVFTIHLPRQPLVALAIERETIGKVQLDK
jgi:PAS domain S-box-containing protein